MLNMFPLFTFRNIVSNLSISFVPPKGKELYLHHESSKNYHDIGIVPLYSSKFLQTWYLCLK